MVNPYEDPRYELARMLREQRGGQQRSAQPPRMGGPALSQGAVRLGRTAAQIAQENPYLREQLGRIREGEKAAPGGLMGTILNNPITKVALAPLEVLAVPGRAAVSAVREYADIFDGNPNTKASFSDFISQTKDKTFGFGKAFDINTGSKWLDRAIGFVGDVALDPLTYATFGAGKFAGYGGRLQLSKEVLKVTGDADLAQRVVNYGRSAIKSPEIMDAVGANRYGIYFLGKRIKVGKLDQGLRLPGSGIIGEIGDSLFTRLRLSASNTKLGQVLTRMTTPADSLAARTALRSGNLPPEEFKQIMGFISSQPVARTTAGVVLQRETQELGKLFDSEKPRGFESYRKNIYKALEDPTVAQTVDGMQEPYQVWKDFFDRLENSVGDALKEVDPSATIGRVDNYFPWIRSDEASDFLGSNAPFAERLREGVFSRTRDPFEAPGRFKSRGIRPGDDWFGYKLKPEDLNVERLNALARQHGGLKFDFFETDIAVVASKYIEDYAKEMGIISRYKHMVDEGFWSKADDIMRETEMIDDDAVKAARNAVQEVNSKVQDTLKEAIDSVREFSDSMAGRTKNMADQLDSIAEKGGELAKMEGLARTANDIDAVIDGGRVISGDELLNIAGRLKDVQRNIAEMFGATVTKRGTLKEIPDVLGRMIDDDEGLPLIAEGITNYIGRLEGRISALGYAIQNNLEEAADFTSEIFSVYSSAVKSFDDLSVALTKDLRLAQEQIKTAMEFGNFIENTMERIAAGSSPTEALDYAENLSAKSFEAWAKAEKVNKDFASEALKELRASASSFASMISKDVKVPSEQLEAIGKALGTRGKKDFKSFVSMYAETSFFDSFNSYKKIPKTNISSYEPKDFYDNLPMVHTTELSLEDVRKMGMYVLSRDTHLYAGSIPSTLEEARKNLYKALVNADFADALQLEQLKKLSSKQGMTADDIFDAQWGPAISQVLKAEDDIQQIDKFLDVFTQRMSINLDEEISLETIINNLSTSFPFIDRIFGSVDSYRAAKIDFYEELMGARNPSIDAYDDVLSETTTMGKVLDAVKAERARLDSYLNGEASIKIGQGVTQELYNGKTLLDKAQKVGRQKRATTGQGAAVPPPGVTNIRSGRVSSTEFPSRRIPKTVSVSQARNDLSDALIEYSLVSEVTMRFESAANVLSGFGMVPTESMFNRIVDSVSSTIMPQIDSKIATLNEAKIAMQELQSEVFNRLKISEGQGKTPGMVFKEVMSEFMNSPKGQIIREGYGGSTRWIDDPYELRRALSVANKSGGRAAKRSVYDNRIRPWFESAFPGEKWSQKAADLKLKQYSPSAAKSQRTAMVSPFADSADMQTIRTWFQNAIGYSDVSAGGRVGNPTSLNDIDTRLTKLKNIRRKFNNLLLPDLEAQAFFADPLAQQRTPSWYASLLDFRAQRLDDLSEQISTSKNKLNEVEISRLNLIDDARETQKLAQQMRAGRALPDSLKEGGDVRQARADIKKYQSFTQSVNYTKAIKDQEMVDVMKRLAGVDLSTVSGGFVIGNTIDSTGRSVPTFASLPDGTRLLFTREEWDSLFTPLVQQKDLPMLRNNLRTMSTRDIPRQRSVVKAAQEAVDASPAKNVQRTNAWRRLQQEQEKLDSMLAEYEQMRFDYNISKPGVREAALKKFEILTFGTKSQPKYFNDTNIKALSESYYMTPTSWNRKTFAERKIVDEQGIEALQQKKFFGDLDLSKAESEDLVQSRIVKGYGASTGRRIISSEEAARRAKQVESVWNATEEASVIRQAEELRNSVYVVAYNDMMAKPSSLANQIDELTKRRDSVLGELGSQFARQSDDVAWTEQLLGEASTEVERRLGSVVEGARESIGIGAPLSPAVGADEVATAIRGRAEGIADVAVPTGQPFERMVGPVGPSRELSARTQATVEQMQRLDEIIQESSIPYFQAKSAIETTFNGNVNAVKAVSAALDNAKVVESALRAAKQDVLDEMAVVAGDVDSFFQTLYNRRAEFHTLAIRLEQHKALVETLPQDLSVKELKKLYSKSGKIDDEKAMNALSMIRGWLDRNKDTLDGLYTDPDDPVNKAFAAAALADAKLLDLEFKSQDALARLALAEEPRIFTEVVEKFSKEWEKAAKGAGLIGGKTGNTTLKTIGLPGLIGNEEAVKLLSATQRINKPGVAADLSKFMTGYTRFFKAYATLSPGFHVRNTISSVFSMFSAGADIQNMRDGFRLWRSFAEHASRGGDLDSWLKTIPEAQSERAQIAAQVMLGLGGGRTDEALIDYARKGGPLRDNPLLRWSQRTGHGVEGSARFILAYDSAAKGMNMSTSFERTHRYLVDYFNRTILDESMRDIVPFWMWMSRNLPLQIINRWANPKAYLVYDKFAKNVGIGVNPEEGFPSYLQEQGGIRIGEETFLTPDLPFTRIGQQVNEFANPRSLLGYVNPGIRVPMEVLSGTKFGQNAEFNDKYQKLTGVFRAFEPLLKATGQVRYNSDGEPVVSERAMYAILGMVPPVGTVERLFPSTEQYKERNAQSLLSFAGIPIRTVDKETREREIMRRLYEMQRLRTNDKSIREAQ